MSIRELWGLSDAELTDEERALMLGPAPEPALHKVETQVRVTAEPSSLPGGRGEEGKEGPYVDLAALLAGGLPLPPRPSLLEREEDGVCLFYSGQVNMIFGDPESGKTWVALAAAAERLIAGGTVYILDLDHNGAAQTAHRLLSLGVHFDTVTDPSHLRYAEPEDRTHLVEVINDAVQWRPGVVVVDSIGEVLPMLGLSSNGPDDFTQAHSRILKPLALRGCTVLAIDHLSKSTESRQAGPTGTAAKTRVVGGVSLRATLRETYRPGVGGATSLSIRKDRPGGLRAACPPATGGAEQAAGVFILKPGPGESLTWRITKPTSSDAEIAAMDSTGVPQADLVTLSQLDPPPHSVDDVKERCKWGSARASNALKVWRSSHSQERSGNEGNVAELFPPTCRRCGLALSESDLLVGDVFHAFCGSEGA